MQLVKYSRVVCTLQSGTSEDVLGCTRCPQDSQHTRSGMIQVNAFIESYTRPSFMLIFFPALFSVSLSHFVYDL